jgi:hypothetical protein
MGLRTMNSLDHYSYLHTYSLTYRPLLVLMFKLRNLLLQPCSHTTQSERVPTQQLVLGKFGLKPIQTWFKPNTNHLRWFGLGKSQSV